MRCRRVFDRAPTVLIWRKGTHSPKVRALMEVLIEHSDIAKKPTARRKTGATRGLSRHAGHRTVKSSDCGTDLGVGAQHGVDRLNISRMRASDRALDHHHQLRLVGRGAPDQVVLDGDAHAVGR